MLPLSEETNITFEAEERSVVLAFASEVTRMVGPMAQVRYMRSCAENDGSSRDSVTKYPAVMMTILRWDMLFLERKARRVLLASGLAMSMLGM
jgi:hypothetical protein